MARVKDALIDLNITEWTMTGKPSSEVEFNNNFKKITGVDENERGIVSTNPSDFGVTWKQITDKQKELQTAERYGDQLRATLQKHNLTHLANKKPGMIEKRMQNATNRLWDCLTDITDPEWVRMAAGSESSNCNKNSKNRSSDSAAPKASPAK